MSGAGIRQDLQHLEAAVFGHQFEAAAEQEISDQHRCWIAEHDICRRLAAAQIAAVDDIVMQEGRRDE